MATYGPAVSSSRVGGRRAWRAAALAALLAAGGCEVDWAGGSFRLENPAPEPEVPVSRASGTADAPPPAPLPDGPLLFSVALDRAAGSGRAVAVARLGPAGPEPLGIPDHPDDGWAARFDSAFHPAGRTLALHAAGRRIGSLVLDGTTAFVRPGCPPVAGGRVLLTPGGRMPARAFAFPAETSPDAPDPLPLAEPDDRMRTFGPILAERLLREGGEARPYLAQRADLRAVAWPGDEAPAMAATYLVGDSLGGPPPARAASSLFFLARFDPSRGYVPEWSEVRRYDGDAGREIFVYRGAAAGPGGRIDFVERWAAGPPVLLAASRAGPEGRGIEWTEAAACPSGELLAGALPPPEG
ncbi:MAG: hypothetical protein RRA92_02535 [Gemmatimonadota bacterium]|nr:hypothetical protein [Gemmatimonadota bacterium]